MLPRDVSEDRDMRRSLGSVALVVATLASAALLALGLGQWHVHSLAEQGRALVAEGQYLPAVRVLSEVVAEAPDNARAHYYLGLAYAGIGLCGAASIHLDEAMRLVPATRAPAAEVGPNCLPSLPLPGFSGPLDPRLPPDPP